MMETHPNSPQHFKTRNTRGFMHPLSAIGRKFILFSKETSPVLEMGCAYGNVVIAALNAGAQTIIACDMSQEHLDILRENLNEAQLEQAILRQGYLPNGFNFDDNSIGAIHASHILEYLNDIEIDCALANFYRWLKPGGQLFIKCYTIYIKELMNERFQTEYQKRLDLHVRWPGYLRDFNSYSDLPDESNVENLDSAFPPDLHMFEKSILAKALTGLGFRIEFADYLEGRENGAVEETLYDGREFLGIIASKGEKNQV